MRITLIITCLSIAPILGYAQVPSLANFYNKYKKSENVRDIKIQGWLLKLAAKFADEPETHNLLRKITYLRALIIESGNPVKSSEYSNLLRSLRQDEFEPLVQLREGRSRVDLLIRENSKHITDALVVVYGEEGFILLSIEGKLRFSDLNDLKFDIDGSEHFKKLPEEREALPKV